MNVLEVLALATQAAQAASARYESAVAKAREVEQLVAQQQALEKDLAAAESTRDAAEAEVRTAQTRVAQQIKALSLASPVSVQAAQLHVEAQRAALTEAEAVVATAREGSTETRARVNRAVLVAEHAARIRDAINAASDVTDASANFSGAKEAAFAHAKLLEARAASVKTANDAALHVAACTQEADLADSITMKAEIRKDTARGAVMAAETALSMAQSAHAAVQTVIDALNQSIGNE